MTVVEQMAEFAVHSNVGDLSVRGLLQLKVCILDALGCALGGFDGDPVRERFDAVPFFWTEQYDFSLAEVDFEKAMRGELAR